MARQLWTADAFRRLPATILQAVPNVLTEVDRAVSTVPWCVVLYSVMELAKKINVDNDITSSMISYIDNKLTTSLASRAPKACGSW